MLKILERELMWKYYFAQRIATRFTKASVFPKAENSGTDTTGKWDETLFAASDINAYQEASRILAFSVSQGSKGSFVQDIDKNIHLDLCGTENLPLGHNNTGLTKLVDSKEWDNYVINSNLDCGHKTSANFAQLAAKTLQSIRPADHLQGVTLTDSRNATEQALIDAFSQRKGTSQAIGFGGSNHGQALAMQQFAHPGMSMTMGWPCLAYPERSEKALDEVRAALKAGNIAAVMIEPVNWSTGAVLDSTVINQIGKLAHEFDAALIVDETNTGGGATGKGFWAYSGDQADYVSFGKRTQASGYFTNAHDQVLLGGSEFDVALLAQIKKEIDGNSLLEQVQRVGKAMHQSVSRAAEKSSRITSINSVGTMMWINTATAKDASELRDHLRREGVLVKLNGSKGVTTKPALTLDENQTSALARAIGKF